MIVWYRACACPLSPIGNLLICVHLIRLFPKINCPPITHSGAFLKGRTHLKVIVLVYILNLSVGDLGLKNMTRKKMMDFNG